MRKFDVSVIGELNVDLILNQIDTFPSIGKEILSKQMDLTLGSSSAIFASNISSLGTRVTFIGKLGNDIFGDLVLQSLQRSNVDTSAVVRCDNLRTGATVVLNYGEDRAMITHPGAMDYLEAEDINWDIIKQSGHLHFSSFFIQKAIQKDVGNIFRKAKEEGLTTSFDMQWDPSERWEIDYRNILPHVDIFLPNEKELMLLTGSTILDDAIKQLEGIANTVVVKQGNNGSTIYHAGSKIYRPAFINTMVVDAIGAGDSFNAGFICKFIKKHSLEKCQEFGNLIGAMSTTEAGGTKAFRDTKNILKTAKEKFGYADK